MHDSERSGNPYQAPALVGASALNDDAGTDPREIRRRYAHRETTLRALALGKVWTALFAILIFELGLKNALGAGSEVAVRIGAWSISLAAAAIGRRLWTLRDDAPYWQATASGAVCAVLIGLGAFHTLQGRPPSVTDLFWLGVVVLTHARIVLVCGQSATHAVCSETYREIVRTTTLDSLRPVVLLKLLGWSVLWWVTLAWLVTLGVAALV